MSGNILYQLLGRNAPPATPVLLFRIFLLFCIAQVFSGLGLLSSQWLASSINFSLSAILNVGGINNTWHKRMLTTDGKALYIEHEYILIIALIVFILNMLWLQGGMKTKPLWITGGIVALYTTHLLCYALMLFYTAPNALFYCAEFVVMFAVLYLYARQYLVKQAF